MQIYLVGGAVRDKLMGLEPKDRDYVVVGATPQDMLDRGFKPVGADFPVFLNEAGEEFALARTERKTGTGYHGFETWSAPTVTIEEDLARRDLTINAMAMDEHGNVIDPFGGRHDITDRLLRHVSDAFAEDPLRVLRVARFAARYGPRWSVATSTKVHMLHLVENGELEHLTPERVWKETERALVEAHPDLYFTTLMRVGAMDRVFPELLYFPITGPFLPEVEADLTVRFCTLTRAMLPTTLREMCDRLRVPANLRDTAVCVAENWGEAKAMRRLAPLHVVRFLEKIDAFRRPERVDVFEQLLIPQDREILRFSYEIARNVKAVDLGIDLVRTPGPDIGKHLQYRRALMLRQSPHFQ